MKKKRKEMPTDKCGNFWFLNKVGGEYVFAKEPIYIDKSTTYYYKSKLPTVFTFQEWEELLLDSNLWNIPAKFMFDQLVKEFYDKYNTGQWEISADEINGWYNITWIWVWDWFRYVFWLKEWNYNPFINEPFDDRKWWSYFYSSDKVNHSSYGRYALWISRNRVCSCMVSWEDTPLWIRPVTLFPNREISYNKEGNFIYLKI